MDKLLLHVCCAPCSILVIDFLKKDFELYLYFYNPNIHPSKEYNERLTSFINYSKKLNYKYLIGEYDYSDYFKIVGGDIENRCVYCYQLRLNEVARKSKELNIKNFSTTMLYSIYQKHNLIKKIGNLLSIEYNLNFIYYDLRDKYFEGKKKAYEENLYIQKYCGCIFSENERYKIRVK
ncbi:MAG: epoxyqueuosine reductase QueH [Caldisericia bacterium]